MATRRLTLDLGTRFETVNSDATGDISRVSTTSIVPRLGGGYDLQGNGSTVLFATYGHYSGKYSQVQFGVNTNVGRPDEVDYVYTRPGGPGLRLCARVRPGTTTARCRLPPSRRRTSCSPTA